MAQLTVPVVFDHDDLQRLVNEKIAEVKAQFIPKADYETRLKADMVAMLEELYMEIEELDNPLDYDFEGFDTCVVNCEKLIQQKIDKLKGETDEKK